MIPEVRETWNVRKPEVRSSGGVVSTQHYRASEIGARVLAEGGNAVDAAVTAGLALGTVEPWMSGLGGCGQMIVHLAGEGRAWSVDFGLVASGNLDPADYPLDEGRGSDLFNWPAVAGDRNVMGPGSIAVPTWAAGVAAALERFGTRSWEDCIAPAVELAERGLVADWYATLKIASTAARLAADDECRRVYLPGGFPPCSEWGGPPPRLRLGRLAETLRRLGQAGARDFYEGARSPARSSPTRSGSGRGWDPTTSPGWRSAIRESLAVPPRRRDRPRGPRTHRGAEPRAGARVSSPSAAPRRNRAIGRRPRRTSPSRTPMPSRPPTPSGSPSSVTTRRRPRRPARPTSAWSTREGNLVALTQTLLSLFGSRVMFPGDGGAHEQRRDVVRPAPRPSRTRSLRGAGRSSNMCPVVVERSGRRPLRPRRVGRTADHARGDAARLVSRGLRARSGGRVPCPADRCERRRVRHRRPEVSSGGRGRPAASGTRSRPGRTRCTRRCMLVRTGRARCEDGGRVGAAYVMSPWALAAPAGLGLTSGRLVPRTAMENRWAPVRPAVGRTRKLVKEEPANERSARGAGGAGRPARGRHGQTSSARGGRSTTSVRSRRRRSSPARPSISRGGLPTTT